eukprot:6793105-Prymnesium_polylepis.1
MARMADGGTALLRCRDHVTNIGETVPTVTVRRVIVRCGRLAHRVHLLLRESRAGCERSVCDIL